MKNENTQQVCTNCKYFKRHYVVADRGALSATSVGHCAHPKIKDSVSAKHIRHDEGCDLWQPHELQKLSIKYSIEQSLQNISDKVTEMLEVLRNVE